MPSGLKRADSVLPGIQTFVSDKSTLDLPTNIDREKDSVLPPGSATPRSTRDREIGKFEFNRPDNDIDERPRTLGLSGEEYGHPTKYDYNMPTRRSITGFKSGPPSSTKQRKQRVKQRVRDHLRYKKDRSRKLRQSLKRYHHFCKRNRQCMRKREMQRKYPSKYRRRSPLSESAEKRLTRRHKEGAAGISFWLNPTGGVGKILFAEEGHVVFRLDSSTEVLPISVFSRVATFFDQASFDKYLDAVVMVPDLDAETVHGVGALYDIDTTEMPLDRLSPERLKKAFEVITAGDVILFDRAPPNEDINRPDQLNTYDVSGPDQTFKKPKDRDGLPPSFSAPSNQTDDVPAGSSRVVPNGEGQFWSGDATYMFASSRINKRAVRISEIQAKVDGSVLNRAKSIRPKLSRADSKNSIYFFEVPSSEGAPYRVKLQALRKGNVVDLQKMDVLVTCSCDFFRWQGPEHWAKTNGFLYGKPRGTASAPVIKDPASKHWACKHVISVFNFVKGYGYKLSSATPDYAAGILWGQDWSS